MYHSKHLCSSVTPIRPMSSFNPHPFFHVTQGRLGSFPNVAGGVWERGEYRPVNRDT